MISGTPEELLRAAIEKEKESQRFYAEAAQRCNHPLGKATFESLVKDEQRHQRKLEAMLQKRGVEAIADTGAQHSARKRFDEMLSKLAIPEGARDIDYADDIKAIEIAMEKENAAYRLYSDAIPTAEGELRNLYQQLAAEESEHYKLLLNSKQYLSNPPDYFLWEEQGLLDGGP